MGGCQSLEGQIDVRRSADSEAAMTISISPCYLGLLILKASCMPWIIDVLDFKRSPIPPITGMGGGE